MLISFCLSGGVLSIWLSINKSRAFLELNIPNFGGECDTKYNFKIILFLVRGYRR